MRAELRDLDSADAPEGLAAYRPEDPESFCLAVGATIGPEGGEGGDLFYFSVCTAKWLVQEPPPKGFEFLHGYLRLEHWDFELVLRTIRDLCLHTEGKDWNEVATELSRYGSWEFANYKD